MGVIQYPFANFLTDKIMDAFQLKSIISVFAQQLDKHNLKNNNMLEHGKKISKDLSEFLKFYLKADDLKNVSEELSNDGYKVTVSLLRMVLNRNNNITEDNNMRAIGKLIVIAARKRRITNPKFNKVIKDYSDIINQYKTK